MHTPGAEEGVGDWVFEESAKRPEGAVECPECGCTLDPEDWACAECGAVLLSLTNLPVKGRHPHSGHGSKSGKKRSNSEKVVSISSRKRVHFRFTPAGISIAVAIGAAVLVGVFLLGQSMSR